MQKAAFILLPPEHDPDSLIKAEGPEAFEREIRRALGLVDFTKSLLLDGKDLLYAEDRAKVVAEGKACALQMTKAPMLRLALIEEIAAIARVSTDEIQRQYGLVTPPPAVAMPPAPRPRYDGRFRPQGQGYGNFGGGFDRFGYGAPRWQRREYYAPEPRITVADFRERILQLLLAHPVLVNEFSGVIEEEFLGSNQPVAQQIIEVWRAAAVLEDEAPGSNHAATLLSLLSESEWAPVYEELLAGEMLLETPEEGARLEIRRNFLTLELERVKLRVQTLVVRDEKDEAELRRMVERKTELDRLIAETQKAEFQYRLRRDTEKAYEYLQKRDRKEGHGGGMVLDKNPKVRALQAMLFGMKPGDDEAQEGENAAQSAPKAPEKPSAVVEALQALRSRRAAPAENGVSADENWLDDNAPPPDDVPADYLSTADGEEEDVPYTFDDDAPSDDY